MATLLLHFPGGRYHATAWGHHVNEGVIEWPPSPWRILRALIACGYSTQGWIEVAGPARRMIESLSEALPVYRLPPASVAHTRHFMPLGVLEKGRERTTLVFDAWADVGDGALAVRWPVELDAEASKTFETLVPLLGYLGRSESWVTAESIGDSATLPRGSDAFPHVEGQHADVGWEQVSLLAPMPADSYRAWRDGRLAAVAEAFPVPEGKKISKKVEKDRARAIAPYPSDLIECLQRDTAWWQGHRWSQPPGSRRVLYWRRSDALAVGPPSARRRSVPRAISTMLLALTTPSGSRTALPTISRALPQAELLHRSLVGRAARGGRIECPELTGRDAAGRPLTGHRHAHVLPLDLDRDGHLDHILVHAPMGLGPTAQSAVRSLNRTWTKGGVGELQVALAGHGELDDLREIPAPIDVAVESLLGPKGGASSWVSFTPLVLPRFCKQRGANTLSGQVNSELACRGLPAADVEVLPWQGATAQLRHAVRVRGGRAKPPPVDAGFAVRLSFARPVSGPIALGYGSHFGLGLFLAESGR